MIMVGCVCKRICFSFLSVWLSGFWQTLAQVYPSNYMSSEIVENPAPPVWFNFNPSWVVAGVASGFYKHLLTFIKLPTFNHRSKHTVYDPY